VHADGRTERIFFNDFEQQTEVGPQPITTPTIRLGNYTPGRWYLERGESLFRIEESSFARSGRRVGVADANLRK
jgi:hypothetical protein